MSAHASLAASCGILIAVIPLFRQESKLHLGSYSRYGLMEKNTPLSSFSHRSNHLLHIWKHIFFSHCPYVCMSTSDMCANRDGARFKTTVFTVGISRIFHSRILREGREMMAEVSLSFTCRYPDLPQKQMCLILTNRS